MVKKKIVIVGSIVVILLVVAGAYLSALSHVDTRERLIAEYLYTDQPTKALREIKILLFFHADNAYGKRVYDLLTKKEFDYP